MIAVNLASGGNAVLGHRFIGGNKHPLRLPGRETRTLPGKRVFLLKPCLADESSSISQLKQMSEITKSPVLRRRTGPFIGLLIEGL